MGLWMKPIPFKVRGMINGSIIGAIYSAAFIALRASITLTAFLTLLLSLIFGAIGYLQPERFAHSNQVDENRTGRAQSQMIQFSLARLLLATAMVALVFGVLRCCFNYKEPMEIVAASMIAFALGGLVLVTKKIDYIGIVFMIALFVVIAIVCGIIMSCGLHM